MVTTPIANTELSDTFDFQRRRLNDVVNHVNNLSNTSVGIPTARANSIYANTVNITSNASFGLPRGTTAERGVISQGILRFNTTNTKFEGHNGTTWENLSDKVGVYDIVSANTTAVANQRLAVDTSLSAIEVTLPTSPNTDDIIEIVDKNNTFSTNNLTINRNGETINGVATNLVLDLNSTSITFQFDGVTWNAFGHYEIDDPYVIDSGTTTFNGNQVNFSANVSFTGNTTLNGDVIVSNTYSESTYAKKTAGQTFIGGQAGTITALGSVAANTITLDMSLGNHFSVTVANNLTIATPTNQTAGQGGSIFITQDGTGNRTIAFSTAWKFVDGEAPIPTTTPNAVDRIDYMIASSNNIHAVMSNNLG